MKILATFSLLLCAVHSFPAEKQEAKNKPASSADNTIPQAPKYETIYQQQAVQQLYQQPLQQKPQLVPVQVIPKQYYVPQAQPHAMIIIAQPAVVPQSLVYGNAMQQLLNYFHSNPQAKYQLLHGNYQQQAQQQSYVQPVLAQPSVGNYIVASQLQPQYTQQLIQPQYQQYQQQVQPQYQQQVQPQYQQQKQAHQPSQLSSIAHLAQLAAQQYVSTQMKSAPAIVTGFEQFTPEQQAQIKAQLSSQLGADFHAVSTPNQYSSKYVEQEDSNSNSFVPSPQIKNEQASVGGGSTQAGISSTQDILKTRYVKQKH